MTEQTLSPEQADTEAPAAKRPARRRVTRPAGEAAATPAEAAAPAPTEEAPKKATRKRATTAKAVADPVAATEAEPAEKPVRKRATRATGTTKAAEPADSGPPPKAEPLVKAPARKRAPAKKSQTPTEEPPEVAPRLATTALLFQAPDLTAAPVRPARKRVTRPAGATDVPTFAAAEVEAVALPLDFAVADIELPAPRVQARKKPTRELSEIVLPEKSAKAEPAEVVSTGATTEPPPPPAKPKRLTKPENAAAKEVGAIEAELVAEGAVIIELGELDMIEDDPDVEIVYDEDRPRRRRRRGGRGRKGGSRSADGDEADESVEEDAPDEAPADEADGDLDGSDSSRRRRRRSRTERTGTRDRVTALEGSTRLEAKRQRRRDGRDAGRRRQIITEAEFLARRESVTRTMLVREANARTQIAVLEDGVLVEHYVSQQSQASMVGNVYLGRVQNVLPSMEAAFVDVGKGRNAVLYAGEVNWDAAGVEGGSERRIEDALKSGDSVLVQVTKDPIGHKGARLTSQITLAGRYLVLVPGGSMTGISRKLPDVERSRLKKILREIVPDDTGVIVRTAAEGASEQELTADVERLKTQWEAISKKAGLKGTNAPTLLQGEPDLAIRVVRDIFNDDFNSLVVQGDGAWQEISTYVEQLAPDLRERVTKWVQPQDVFTKHRIDEQLAKGMDRKVWLPSGGSLVIDRTEAMTVVDVNTGKFTGSGGTLEETVTRNNLEAAEEIVRQLRLRDIGGIIVIDFIDMVLESNRDLVLRRLVECLGRDRTKHQVAEVTSLGLVQMTRKRVGQGLVEAFSETCEHCKGRGFIVHQEPRELPGATPAPVPAEVEPTVEEPTKRPKRKRASRPGDITEVPRLPEENSEAREAVKNTLASIAAAADRAHEDADREQSRTRSVSTEIKELVDKRSAEHYDPAEAKDVEASETT
ncbi:MAG: Rne/Rng family ribonuclease [Promicromonosporaceae bacterium]|nr:Rne/Rng family ribonuclease [Promicromonosporaceae bacterium]